MDEISSAVSVTVSLSSSSCDSSGILGQVEMTGLKLVSETSNLLFPSVSVSNWDISCSTLTSEVEYGTMAKEEAEAGDIVLDESNETVTDEMLPLDDSSKISLPISVEIEKIEKGRIVGKVICLGEPTVEKNGKIDVLTVASNPNVEVIQFSGEKSIGIIGTKSVLKVDCVPLWGTVSICGLRPEMEDAVAAVPWFMKVPIEMFIGDHAMNGLSRGLSHMSTHFFGVYDGHGGHQVADYCRDRMHFALGEELKDIAAGFVEGRTRDSLQREWENAFSHCFSKVDEEVGGQRGSDDTDDTSHLGPIAPETAGSTAVVALLCSSHIVVANCGDSRAVLYRGKESIALSVDHKPNREDEYARIEASGGKVIQWNGHRLFGVLAMSRAIGDRYMKPWIIPEPEVMFIPRKREDECLVIASDGLWDVMSNEEACEVARRRILLWHKKNGDSPLPDRGQGADPASQAAAEYLSALALQKGSKDNISVIVVDLKAQRKFKTKS